MRNRYLVEFMSKWSNRWATIECFDDVYEAVDNAVKMSKEESKEPHKVRVYDFAEEKTVLRLEIV